MGKKEEKERLFNKVEDARNEYLRTCDVADDCYGRLDHQREESINALERSEGLINSIRHTPFSVKKEINKVSRERKTITTRADLEKEQRAANRKAGITAVMAIGVGGFGFKDYKDTLFDKFNLSDDDRKNTAAILIIFIVFIVLIAIGYFIWKAKINHNALKKASLVYKKTKAEIQKLKKHIASAEENIIELRETRNAIESTLQFLSKYKDWDFTQIPDNDQKELFTLVNLTQALSSVLSQDI